MANSKSEKAAIERVTQSCDNIRRNVTKEVNGKLSFTRPKQMSRRDDFNECSIIIIEILRKNDK